MHTTETYYHGYEFQVEVHIVREQSEIGINI